MRHIAVLLVLVIVFPLSGFAQTTLTATQGTPTLDGVVSPGEWTSNPLVTQAGVTLNAMADGQFLYVSASWTDTTESIPKNQWAFDGSNWSKSGNEDRISFIWDMGLNGTDGADCATMCHVPLMYTNVGNVDVWHWKSARGNAIGFADDKYWDTADRQSDPGTSAYQDNNPMGSGFPSFMAAGDPGANVNFLAADATALSTFDPYGTVAAHTVAVATPFDSSASFSAGNVIPGYLHRIPAGDRASVQSAGKFDTGTWTVEFAKPYAGGSFDFAVVPGTSVDFTHEIFDNQGGSHPNDGFDATVYKLDLAQIPAQVNLVVTQGTPTLDGVVSPGEWTSNPLVTQAGVTLNAMADGQFLYVSASWTDTTESIPKNQWAFDGSNWSKSGNEDRISFIWDMGLNGTDGADCATMCHVPLMYTNVGNVDVWHWKSARGNAIGFADDKYWDTADRQSDPGTSAYQDNNPMGSGFPSFMAAGDPGANVDFLAADATALSTFDPYGTVAAHTVALAVPFDSTAAFSAGNVIPGYLHRNPSGDRASVESAGKYDTGTWTVEFAKPYAGGVYDFAVIPGSSVEFTHEIFDNQGGSHPNDGFDATVYALDFAVITGVSEPVSGLVPVEYLLTQNYPNPFNPSTTIRYGLPERSHVVLKVFSVLGEEVATLVDEVEEAGVRSVKFDAGGLASGLYLYRVRAGSYVETKKMLLVR